MDSPLRDMETQYKYNDHNHCPEKDSPCGIEGSHRCCLCGSLQKESEWEEKIRVAARLRPSTEESAMEYADEAIKEVKKAIANREKEIAEEVKKKINSAGGLGGWKHLDDILNEIILKH